MRDLRRELAFGLERLLDAADDVEAGRRPPLTPHIDLALPAPPPVPAPSLARLCLTDVVTTVVVAATALTVGWAATGALPEPARPSLGAQAAEVAGAPSAYAAPMARTVAIGDAAAAAGTPDVP